MAALVLIFGQIAKNSREAASAVQSVARTKITPYVECVSYVQN